MLQRLLKNFAPYPRDVYASDYSCLSYASKIPSPWNFFLSWCFLLLVKNCWACIKVDASKSLHRKINGYEQFVGIIVCPACAFIWKLACAILIQCKWDKDIRHKTSSTRTARSVRYLPAWAPKHDPSSHLSPSHCENVQLLCSWPRNAHISVISCLLATQSAHARGLLLAMSSLLFSRLWAAR